MQKKLSIKPSLIERWQRTKQQQRKIKKANREGTKPVTREGEEIDGVLMELLQKARGVEKGKAAESREEYMSPEEYRKYNRLSNQ